MKNKRRGIIAICICMIFLCVSVYAMEYISKPDKKNNSSSKIDSEKTESKIVEPKIIIPQTIGTIRPKPTEVNTSNKNDYINKKEDSKNLDNVKTIIPKSPHVNDNVKTIIPKSPHVNDNIKIFIPKSSHVGDLVKVTTSNISYLSLDKVTKGGKEVDFSKYIEGNIEKDGCVIKFNEKGSYSFRLICKDLLGKAFKYEITTNVYPIIETKFSMPKIAYENDLVEIKTLFKNTEHVKWDIFKDGKSVSMKDVIEGTISDEGGKIKFKNKGEYELKTSSIDATGRKFEYSSSITIYPEIAVDFDMDKFTHTDKKVLIKPTIENVEYPISWNVYKGNDGKDILKSLENNLSNNGGYIQFNENGIYTVKLTVKDKFGKVYEKCKEINVYPILSIDFNLPKTAYTDTNINVYTKNINNLPVEWEIVKDGKSMKISDVLEGTLNEYGGKIRFKNKGEYEVIATIEDKVGRKYSTAKYIKVSKEPDHGISNSLPTKPVTSVDVTNIVKDGKFFVNIFAESTDADKGDEITYEYEGKLDNNYYKPGSYTVKVRAVDNRGGASEWADVQFNVTNAVPTTPVAKADVTRTFKDGKFLVNISAKSTDTDEGDKITYEYEGKTEDNYYKVGSHVVKVRAKDSCGDVSEWVEIPFTVANSDSTNPITKVDVTRTFKDGKFLVNISAESTDADGDEITYEYEGKTDDNYYKVGSHTVRVRAIDNCGGVSEWVEIPFTVVSSAPTKPVAKADVTRIMKDEKFLVNIFAESTDADGDEITYEYEGKTDDNYYKVGSHTVRVRAKDDCGGVSEWVEIPFTISSSAPTKPVTNADVTRTMKGEKFLVNIFAESTDADGDEITYEYEGKTDDNYYKVGSHTVRVRAKDDCGSISEWVEIKFTVSSSAPTKPVTNADVTRTMKDGKFLVNISAESTDVDDDKITYEYEGKTDDDYYEVGSHTVRVRAKDDCGSISEWVEIKFTVSSSAPTAPTITRTPNGNSVAPNTPVKITATSSDADGDEITYIWENRPSETSVYSLGKNIVRVKAVDSTGKESPWSAIVFFVMDSNGSGGMALTGSGSSIVENGIEDATITNYTFTVPPVDGHSGKDFARVKGFNIKTNAWEQLDYATTENGITFSKTLAKNTYSKLDFYYYTDHTCMYNKSNITYSVEYYFE